MLPLPTTGEARCADQGGPPFDEERSATDGFQDLGLDVALGTRLHQQTQVYQAHVHAGGPLSCECRTGFHALPGSSQAFPLHRIQLRDASRSLTEPEHSERPQEPRPGPTSLRHRPAEVHPPSSCGGFASQCSGSSRAGGRPSPTSCQQASSRVSDADRRTGRVRPLPAVLPLECGPSTIQLGQCCQQNLRSARHGCRRGGARRQRHTLRGAAGVIAAIVTCASRLVASERPARPPRTPYLSFASQQSLRLASTTPLLVAAFVVASE